MVFTAAPSKAGGQRRTETWGICAATPVLCLLLGTAADVTEQENAKTEGAWTIAVIVIFILTIRGIAFYYRKWKSRKKKKTEICVRCSEGVQRLPKPATCIQQFVFWKRQLGHISVVIKGKVVHTRGEIHDYVYRSQEFLSPVSSRELFTAQELRSERMLLLGSARTGISAISQQLLENWASGESKMAYSHVTTISFSDLNSIETPISVKALLEQKCEQLLSVLSDQNSHEKVLIILDGLNEFRYDLNCLQFPSGGETDGMDTAFDIKILVYKIIAGDLLRNADVLVTARGHSVSGISGHFRYLVVIPEFSAADIKDYFNTSNKQIEKCSSESRGESKLLALYAFPVQINMLCDSLRHVPSTCANGGPSVGQASNLGQEGSCSPLSERISYNQKRCREGQYREMDVVVIEPGSVKGCSCPF